MTPIAFVLEDSGAVDRRGASDGGRPRSEVTPPSEETVELSPSLTRYSQAKACKREITFPTTTAEEAEFLQSLLNRGLSPSAGEGWGQRSPSCIIYLTAQKRPLDLFDFGAGEDRAM